MEKMQKDQRGRGAAIMGYFMYVFGVLLFLMAVFGDAAPLFLFGVGAIILGIVFSVVSTTARGR